MSDIAKQLIAENKRTRASFLDLGNCDIEQLPADIGDLIWLESLNLGSYWSERDGDGWRWKASQYRGKENRISDLSPLSTLTVLQTLSCYNTQVRDLSPLSALTALQTLNCNNTQVSDLSPLSALTALQTLNCNNTQVSDLSPLPALTALQRLDCYSTQVRDLSPLSALTALQRLDCYSTQVRDLSPLSTLTALQTLNCYNVRVSDLSPLSALTALQTLNCSNTQVRDLSPLSTLTALQTLNCSNTQVSDLSPLSGLTALQTLNCSSTQVIDLSPLSALTALQRLDCSNMQVIDLSPFSALTALQTLNCYSTQVSDLSPLSGLTALQTLNCSNTQASDLSPLSGLTALQTLNCYNMQVSDLSPLSGLTALQALDCYNTQVSDLSPLSGLTALEALNCPNTAVSDLSPLSALTALQRLDCSDTQVSNLSPLSALTALQWLDCNRTLVSNLLPLSALTALQAFFCCETPVIDLSPLSALTALHTISCYGTQVSDLSPMIRRINSGFVVRWSSKFREGPGIYLEDCPLTNPPAEIVKQGNEAILNYFAERTKSAVDHLYEAKMLVLGEGRAGKSSFIQRLYHPEIKELPREDQSTKGIVIEKHDFSLRNGRTFRLNVWDFGGQQIYHATHQFFLTQRSLYVLLDDTRKDNKSVSDEGFRYWLELIEVFGGHSPTLIFQNEKGGCSKAIGFDGIQRQYNNVRELYSGDLARLDSADKIRGAIEYFAVGLPHIGEELPASWVRIRAEIEELSKQKHCIPVEEFLALCAPHLDDDDKRALFLSSYLHDLGVFLHFQDDPVLRKIVILQNEWATTAVFRILDDEIVKKNLGRFTESDCSRLWQDSVYGSKHLELLALMEKFQLCYKLRDIRPFTWLAPQLLLPDRPTQLKDWGRPGDLVLRYKYHFLPKGIISRLTVRLHRYVLNPEKAWVTGVLFQQPGMDQCNTEALVEILPTGDEIELRARGPEDKALLSVISADLEALNDSFKGLRDKVDKRIPCNCNICRTAVVPGFFAYKDLVRRKEHGRFEDECRNSFEKVQVLELLDGIKLSEPSATPIVAQAPAREPITPVKIFLASSSELQKDRDKFEQCIRQHNDDLVKEGCHLQIVRWENFFNAMSEIRLQNEYNEAIRNCDVFVSLFATKVGQFTEEEFDVAHERFSSTGKQPLIYTFFEEATVTTKNWKKEDHDSLERFQNKLKGLGHYPTYYKNNDDLNLQFLSQLPKIRDKLRK